MTGAAAMMPRRSWAWPAHLVFLLTTLACVIPQAFVLWRALDGRPSILGEAPAVVWGMLCNTLVVAAVAVALAVAIGFASAFLIVRCALPGRRPLSVLLCLPFAVPPFAYATALLGWDGFRHLPLPEGPVGVGVILGLALYPWVYVPAKATLARQGRHYQELAAKYGAPFYTRIDAAATPAQKAAFKGLTAERVTAASLAGDAITAKLTKAPGNGASIGGLKVTTANGWFAARPSGTEDIYKVYAESFVSAEHLQLIVKEAQDIVSDALKP